MELSGPLGADSGYDRGTRFLGLWVGFGCEFCEDTGLDNSDVMDMCCSLPNASWIEGNECRDAFAESLSSSDAGRGSVGDVNPPNPITELAVEDG